MGKIAGVLAMYLYAILAPVILPLVRILGGTGVILVILLLMVAIARGILAPLGGG